MTWARAYVHVILCMCICTLSCLCLLRLVSPRNPTDAASKEHCPWPRKKRGTKMTATLHILWGLSPTCLCTSAKASHCCFKDHLVSLSWLGSFILVCPCALGITVSWKWSLLGTFLLYCLSQTPLPPLTSLHCLLTTNISAPAPSSPGW